VAVLAVDPSSTRGGGGSILGIGYDKFLWIFLIPKGIKHE
jgi:hypothetical protein